ncbi:MAG: hypothetical protein NTV98_01970, partial [Candidatus Roizmanbacteria bacterium]|nr:hypothetical protein [Candidatus Roizmanbacteria bacterium]
MTFTLSSYYSDVYARLLFFFIFISTKKGVVIKKGLLAVLAALLAVLFLYPSPAQAQFKKDFLYKFQSRWTDIAVSSHLVPRLFIINESYSRIEEYNSSGVLQAIHGGFGVGNTQMNRPQAMTLSSTDDLYVLDSGNGRVLVSTMSATPGSALTFTTKWGSYGSGNGQFSNPSGIATDGIYVFIADTDNNRVQRCLIDGTNCAVWPATGNTFGTANGQF